MRMQKAKKIFGWSFISLTIIGLITLMTISLGWWIIPALIFGVLFWFAIKWVMEL